MTLPDLIDRQAGHRDRIAAAFGRAEHYDTATPVQHAVALALAKRIGCVLPLATPRVLELGCGTGYLTASLAAALPDACWTISDLAPEMVARTQARLGLAADYRVVDGENIDGGLGSFDLIASSMAFQWFDDLPRSVERLAARLNPGGCLAFSTMAAGSFPEWRGALAAEGLACGTPDYPDASGFGALCPQAIQGSIEIVDYFQQIGSARSFLGALRTAGARTPASNYAHLSPVALRRAMERLDQGPGRVTYRIAFCLFRNPIHQ